jgi:hypothetical protein
MVLITLSRVCETWVRSAEIWFAASKRQLLWQKIWYFCMRRKAKINWGCNEGLSLRVWLRDTMMDSSASDIAPRRRIRQQQLAPSQQIFRFLRAWFLPCLGVMLCILVVHNWVWLASVARELQEWESEMRRCIALNPACMLPHPMYTCCYLFTLLDDDAILCVEAAFPCFRTGENLKHDFLNLPPMCVCLCFTSIRVFGTRTIVL